jgi:hypothetical protein
MCKEKSGRKMTSTKTITLMRRDEILKRLDKIICGNCVKESMNICIPDTCEIHVLINELYRKTEIADEI